MNYLIFNGNVLTIYNSNELNSLLVSNIPLIISEKDLYLVLI